ncbi:MAG TPA: hypothetical protein VF511_04835, partial [Chthoniobacterales bacterium]
MLALIFLIIFPFALYKAMQNVKMAKASTGCPTTTGTVTASGVKKSRHAGRDCGYRRRCIV